MFPQTGKKPIVPAATLISRMVAANATALSFDNPTKENKRIRKSSILIADDED